MELIPKAPKAILRVETSSELAIAWSLITSCLHPCRRRRWRSCAR